MAEIAALSPIIIVAPRLLLASIASYIVALSSATIPLESATRKSLHLNVVVYFSSSV